MKKILRMNRGLGWRRIFSLANFGTVFEYELLALWATRGKLLNALLLLPILNLSFLGAGIASFAPKDASVFGTTHYLAFLLPGMLGIELLRTFSHVIYRLTLDKRYGLQGLKISAGTGVLGYILGILILPAIVFVIQTFVMLLVLFLLSIPLGKPGNVCLMLGVGIISTWFWSALAMLISFAFKKYAQRDLFIALVILPLTLASPAFYSLQNAPKYLQVVGCCNPLTYNIVALREAFLSGHFSGSFLGIILGTLCFIFCVGLLISRGEFVSSET
ncbi:MAG TPA: ABC transporter permease [Amoebophilaceae bacterium]|jgi:ABC-type polysaccharide/polyol phosphate export permease|nr:ABC transporter permease [Amoebophilaceae bacterium]